jgi:hypothetical protein
MKKYFLVLFFSILMGCTSTNIQKSTSDGINNSVTIGYNTQLAEQIANNKDLIFLRISFSKNIAKITEISNYYINPKDGHEEVLVYSPEVNIIGPAYDNKLAFTDKSGFICSAWDSKKILYHPCGTGSRFVRVNKVNSAFRNIVVTPITWGIGAGLNYEVDFENLKKIVDQLGVVTTSKRAWQSVNYIKTLNKDLQYIAKNASVNMPIHINLVNNTGFPSPDFSRSIANLNLSFADKISEKLNINYNEKNSIFDDIDQNNRNKFEAIKMRGKYDVRCTNSMVQISGFSILISCPNSFTQADSNDTLSIGFKLESYSAGTRYPSLYGKDKNISLKVEGNRIYLTNETNAYIELKSISIYGGQEVTDTKIDQSMAPNTTNKVPYLVSDYASQTIIKLFTFNNIKSADIAGLQRVFGVAIKYRLGNGGNFDTLFVKRNVRLASLI